MNKLFKYLICLALIISTLFALASCGQKPSLDFDEVADNLEDEDYVVVHVDDEDDLEAGMVESLYAYDGDNHISIVEYESTKLANLAYESMKLSYDYEIKSLENEIETIKYIIKNCDVDEDDYEDELEELEEELEMMKKETFFGKSGKKVWAATEDAIKDSKGK